MKRLAFLFLLFVPLHAGHAQLATPNENGIRFGHVHLNVPDAEQHAALWEEHFGGVRTMLGSQIAIRFPNMLLVLREQEPTMGSQLTVMDHFGFKVRNIKSFIDKWEAAGLEMGRVFVGAERQTNAYLTFPGGTYVELQEDQGLHEEVTAYHIHFFTAGHEELLNWYAETFELEIRTRGSIGTTTNVPGMNISFGNSNTDRAATEGTAIDHFGFEIDNLEEFCKQLEARGVVFDRPYSYNESIDLGTAFFTDPKGMKVELTEGLGKFF
mgnify:CR=1 FL=1